MDVVRVERLRLRLVTSQGSPYPSRSPRAHPSGWTRTQGLSRMDSHAPPFFWDAPHQDVELAAGSYFTTRPKSSWVGERELLPLTPRHVPDWGARATTRPDGA